LESSVLSTPEFCDWSKKVVLLLHNTSRVEDEPHPNLLREKGGNGFPTMSYLDHEGNLLRQVGHVTPVEQLEAAYQELETGTAGAEKEKQLFLLEATMGNRPYAEMLARKDRLTLSKDEEATVAQQLVNLEFTGILRETPREEVDQAGARYLAMFRKGRIPDSTQDTSFWQYIFAHAAVQNDVPLFEEILAWVRQHKADDARLKRYLPQVEKQLELLKAGQGNG
jgi:hypothetical protein